MYVFAARLERRRRRRRCPSLLKRGWGKEARKKDIEMGEGKKDADFNSLTFFFQSPLLPSNKKGEGNRSREME